MSDLPVPASSPAGIPALPEVMTEHLEDALVDAIVQIDKASDSESNGYNRIVYAERVAVYTPTFLSRLTDFNWITLFTVLTCGIGGLIVYLSDPGSFIYLFDKRYSYRSSGKHVYVNWRNRRRLARWSKQLIKDHKAELAQKEKERVLEYVNSFLHGDANES